MNALGIDGHSESPLGISVNGQVGVLKVLCATSFAFGFAFVCHWLCQCAEGLYRDQSILFKCIVRLR
jgi:hypothetical protein